MQFTFDATQFDPQVVGGGQLPVSDSNGWPVKIIGGEMKPSKSGTGGFVEFTVEVIEGEHEGKQASYRLNLWNTNEKAVEIANRQMSALCYVCGILQITDPNQLANIPFRAVVGMQKRPKEWKEGDPEYTEIKGVKTYEGKNPGEGQAAPRIGGSNVPNFTQASQTAPQTQNQMPGNGGNWQPNQPPAQPAQQAPPSDGSPAPWTGGAQATQQQPNDYRPF